MEPEGACLKGARGRVSDGTGGRTALAEALFRVGALRFGRSTLASGKTTSYTLDLGVVPSDPEAYGLAIDAYRALATSVGEAGFDAVAGVATAGVTFASPLAYVLKKPMLAVGREQSERGFAQPVVGAAYPGCRTLVVDDYVSSGERIRFAAEALRKTRCVVKDAIVLVDRQEGGKANLSAAGLRLTAFVDVEALAEILFEAKKITKASFEAVVKQLR